MNILYSASGVLCLFYIGLLLSKRERELKDYLLSGWFVLILLGIIVAYLGYNEIRGWWPLFEFVDSSVLMHGPFMYLYTQALINQSFHLKRQDLWHVLPFIIGTIIVMVPISQGTMLSETGRNVFLLSKMLVLLMYEIAVLWRLNVHSSLIGDYYSFTEKVDLNWLTLLVWGFLIIWLISATSQFLFYLGVAIPQYGGMYTNLSLSVFVLIMGYFGIRQTHVFSSPLINEAIETSSTTISSPPSDLPENRSSEKNIRFQQLEQYMAEHKPYLDSELSVYKLAQLLDIPPYQLSQLINQYGGKNFFNFINQYRVKEVQNHIRQKTHIKQTLLSIALESGFNSKASFNRVFKKMTGKTPRQYANEANQWE